jgi:hypothetical protein
MGNDASSAVAAGSNLQFRDQLVALDAQCMAATMCLALPMLECPVMTW